MSAMRTEDVPGPWLPVGDGEAEAIRDDLLLLEAVEIWDPISAIDKRPDAANAARLAYAVQKVRKALALAEEELARFVADVLPYGQTHDVGGLPAFTIRGGSKRTTWRHDEVKPAAIRGVADALGYEVRPVEQVIDEWVKVCGFQWKLTGLRALEIDPDEYCEKSLGPPSIVFAD